MKNYTKKHIKLLKTSATLLINEKSKKLKEDGKKVFSFGFGQSPFPIPEILVSALKKNAHKKEYLSVQGFGELRKSIAKYINIKTNNSFSHEDIIIGPGSKQLLFLLQLGFDGEFLFPT